MNTDYADLTDYPFQSFTICVRQNMSFCQTLVDAGVLYLSVIPYDEPH